MKRDVLGILAAIILLTVQIAIRINSKPDCRPIVIAHSLNFGGC